MLSIKPTEVAVAREFFRVELRGLLEKQQVLAPVETLEYLVDLLVRFIHAEKFFVKNSQGKLEDNVLADLYAEYLQGGTEKKKISLQRLGDICLIITGFFSDSLNRKIVDIDYYFGMGGSAYWTLSQIHLNSVSGVFKDLSVKFKSLSGVLGEMSERSGIQNNRDLLRLYERWLLTGNERLRAQLSEHGIATPITIETKVKH